MRARLCAARARPAALLPKVHGPGSRKDRQAAAHTVQGVRWAFSPVRRAARYCSETCREKGRARLVRAAYARRSRRERGGSEGVEAPRCRVCSRALSPGGVGGGSRKGRGRGAPRRAYCSPACYAVWRRDYNREYKRRYRADPENLAAISARRRAARAGRERPALRAKCGECGEAFEAASRAARYCSAACRRRAHSNRSAYSMPPARARGRGPKARCRVCSREFASGGGGGPGRKRAYCSPACHAEGRRNYNREYRRRQRDGLGS